MTVIINKLLGASDLVPQHCCCADWGLSCSKTQPLHTLGGGHLLTLCLGTAHTPLGQSLSGPARLMLSTLCMGGHRQGVPSCCSSKGGLGYPQEVGQDAGRPGALSSPILARAHMTVLALAAS